MGFWTLPYDPGCGDAVDIRPIEELVAEIDAKLRAAGFFGPKEESIMADVSEVAPPRRKRITKITRGPNLPAVNKAGQTPRQTRRHNLFVAAFSEISRRWGGEPRHTRRAMAASRAKRQWKGLPILE